MSQRLSVWAATLAVASALVMPAAVNATAAAAPMCAADSLSLSTGPYGAPGDSAQMHFAVILTNISSQSCTLRGYPGVDLVGSADQQNGPTYSLPRQSGAPQPLTIAPGASASSRLTFLPTPNGWVPRTIVVTPPDTTAQLETPWIPGGIAVLRQDGATHPGTYIGPLVASSDVAAAQDQ
jgi:Protein of unknown function (DUF4232)